MKEMSDFFVSWLPLFQSILLIAQALLMREMLIRMQIGEDRLRKQEMLMAAIVDMMQRRKTQ